VYKRLANFHFGFLAPPKEAQSPRSWREVTDSCCLSALNGDEVVSSWCGCLRTGLDANKLGVSPSSCERALSLSPTLVQGSHVTRGSGERWRPWGKCVVSRSTRWQMHSSPQSKQIIIVCAMTRDCVNNRTLLLVWCGKGLIAVTEYS